MSGRLISKETIAMRSVLKDIVLFCVILGCTSQLLSQSLFESSLSEESLISGSNSYSLTGFIRSAIYLSEIPEGESTYLQSVYAQGGVQLEANPANWARGKAEVRFRYGNEFQEPINSWEIREAYVDLEPGPAGFRVGKFISPWGKGTVFNPTDKITPLDPTVRSPDEDDMFKGIWGVQAHLNLGQFMKITGTWNPLYQPSTLLVDPIPMPGYVNFLEPDWPGTNLTSGNYGVRFDLHSRIVDFSLYGYAGYYHWPGLRLDTFLLNSNQMQPEALNLREEAYRIQMVGADLTLPLGSWIIRAEGAWMGPELSSEEHEYIPQPEYSYTAEIERSWLIGTVILGYYGKHIPEHAPPDGTPSLTPDPEPFLDLLQQGIPINDETINGVIEQQVKAFNHLYNYQ
jgi:hypothetical protein